MNVNLSNVSAGSKASNTESSPKTAVENTESKGFSETLAGVFGGDSRAESTNAKAVTSKSSEEQPSELEGSTQSEDSVQTNELDLESVQANLTDNAEQSTDQENLTQVDSAMDEGLQLLERIGQANQTLNSNSEMPIGNDLPILTAELSVKQISLDELDLIDSKLAQGKSLTEQELDVLESIKSGAVTVETLGVDLAQFVALPKDVKAALAEQQLAMYHSTRQDASVIQQAQPFVSQSVMASNGEKAMMADPAAMATGSNMNMAANVDIATKAEMSAELGQKLSGLDLMTGSLNAASSQPDKSDFQYGLAGQIQAAAGQQGVSAQQQAQARADAAQQAQLPLQLTKELADEQVAERVQMMMSKNLKNLDIRLDPPELGRMQIRMTMNNDLANVHFTVTNPQARDLIEQTLPRLKEMLAQQGMQLADSSVHQQNSGQQQGRYTGQAQHDQNASSDRYSQRGDEHEDAEVKLDLNVATKSDGISFYA